MFAKAYAIASQYTQPLVVSTRLFDKSVVCSLGSFVILNSEGWIATAAHMLDSFPLTQQHNLELQEYNQRIIAIQQDAKLNERQKQKKIKGLKFNPK